MVNRFDVVLRSLRLLPKSDQHKFSVYVIAQSLLSVLDMLGIAIIGLIGIVGMNGFSGTPTSGSLGNLLKTIRIDQFSFLQRISLLAMLSVTILVTRTLLTIYIVKKGLRFLSARTSQLSNITMSKYFNSSLPKLQQYTVQESIFLLTTGINRLILGLLGSVMSIVSDGFLVFLLILAIFIANTELAIVSTLLFFIIFLVLRKFSGSTTTRLSREIATSEVQVNELLNETISNYREITVRNVKGKYLKLISSKTLENADKSAEIAFIPTSGKYIVEASLIIIAFSLSGFQLWLSDAKSAVATLGLFLAAGARITPALLRIQQGLLSIQASIGTSERAYKLIKEFELLDPLSTESNQRVDFLHEGFVSNIEVEDLLFSHSPDSKFHLSVKELFFESGKITAIVGPSGSGKSTLVDLILGILQPNSGRVRISGLPPTEAIKCFPGAISYIPQSVSVSNTSIYENISFGYESNDITDQFVARAIMTADLQQTVSLLPEGINTLIGEQGLILSGGQKQRLGIARAVFTQPKLLVLDEATSSLDGQSEAVVSEAISTLKGQVTVLLIAHRLSTVKMADLVIYMEEGNVIAQGSFEEVRKSVPNFDTQAQLMGL